MSTKYDRIGKGYNHTRKADPYLLGRMLHHLAPMPNGQYLDVGCGTGNYTNAFAKRGFKFTGVDPSEAMLTKAWMQSSNVNWLKGKAENLDLPNQFFDGINASLTIHHWDDLEQGFQELYRVLKPGGKLVVFTSTPAQMRGYWLCHYFPTMLADSIKQMPELAEVESAIKKAGFQNLIDEDYEIHKKLEDQFLYCGKAQPEFYFDEAIRQGISSFSDLAKQPEVEAGLQALQADLASGDFKKIQSNYQNNLGDYKFVIANK